MECEEFYKRIYQNIKNWRETLVEDVERLIEMIKKKINKGKRRWDEKKLEKKEEKILWTETQ